MFEDCRGRIGIWNSEKGGWCADVGNGRSGQWWSGLGSVPTTGSARSRFYFLDRIYILKLNCGANRIPISYRDFFVQAAFEHQMSDIIALIQFFFLSTQHSFR